MEIKLLSAQSYKNRKLIEETQMCACYYCERTFESSKITSWVDDNLTALCPHCHIDSVIPATASVIVNLHKIFEFYFG